MQQLSKRLGIPIAGLWLLAATFITTIGNGMQTFTIGLLLYDRTGSAAAFGGVIILEQGLTFLMQFIAGPWVDRGSPKRTCIQVEIIRGLFVCFASLMLGGDQVVLWIMLMTLVIRVAHPFYRAATFALAPAAIPRDSLGRYNGYTNISLQAGQLLGVIVASPVFYYLGPAVAFFINGLTFLFSALAVSFIQLTDQETISEAKVTLRNAWQQIIGGWGEVIGLLRREVGFIWHLLLNTIDAVAVHLFNLMAVPLIAARYNGSVYWLSVIECAYAIGAMISGGVVEPLSKRWGSRISTMVGIGGQALCFTLLGFFSNQWLTILLCFGLGAFNTISWTVLMTTLQLRIRGAIKGRIGITRNLLTSLITAISIPFIASATNSSLNWALLLSGAICLGFAVLALVLGSPRFLGWRLLGEEPVAATNPAPLAETSS